MIDVIVLKNAIIIPCEKALNVLTPSMTNLLLGIAAQESYLGGKLSAHFLDENNTYGIYRMSNMQHCCAIDYLKECNAALSDAILQYCGFDEYPHALRLMDDLRYATCMIIAIIVKANEALPMSNDLTGLARFWKKHLNKHGDMESFIYHYKRHL